LKILILYAGIGGNRKLWGDNHEITAIENCQEIADVYKTSFPNDQVYVSDAQEYLLNHYSNFDFIWSSPPCQTHSQYRHNVGVLGKGFKPVLPDMALYSQITFLDIYYSGYYVVENVKPYYKPLIEPTARIQRHLFWSNFKIENIKVSKSDIRSKNRISDFEGYEVVANSKIKNKRQVLRNCVEPNLGKHILDQILN
jgi:DNA (cytosine-5)-methyltransferase 1